MVLYLIIIKWGNMGYFNIIESLQNHRDSTINEGSLLRDYKSILTQLEKALLSCKNTTIYTDRSIQLSMLLGEFVHMQVFPVFDVSKLHQREDTKNGRAFIYLDINDVFTKDNVVQYMIEDRILNRVDTVEDIADTFIKWLSKQIKDREAFINSDEYIYGDFVRNFKDVLGVDVKTVNDACKAIESGSGYKKIRDTIIKTFNVALDDYIKAIRGLDIVNHKSVDMTKDTISICCVDTKKNMIYMSRYPGNDRFIINPTKKDWNGYTFDFTIEDISKAVSKIKSLDCFGRVNLSFNGKNGESADGLVSYSIYGD